MVIDREEVKVSKDCIKKQFEWKGLQLRHPYPSNFEWAKLYFLILFPYIVT
jgi:hypothetical protein